MFYESVYSPEYATPIGYVAEHADTSDFNHRFGGSTWTASADEDNACGVPTLLLTLDLKDARLSSLPKDKLTELPLFSFINNSAIEKEQVYQISLDDNTVRLIRCTLRYPGYDDLSPVLVDELKLKLRPLEATEYAIDEDTYWSAGGSFGGNPNSPNGFIRVLGSPVFTDDPIEAVCDCGREMDYVADIGQEKFQGGHFLNGETFFIGECVLYFFLCPDCLRVHVNANST